MIEHCLTALFDVSNHQHSLISVTQTTDNSRFLVWSAGLCDKESGLYVSGTKFAVEHAEDTVGTLVYQWGHQEHWGAIGAIR